MMGTRLPKTCWDVSKWQVINLRICCIWLVDSVESMMMHGLANPKCHAILDACVTVMGFSLSLSWGFSHFIPWSWSLFTILSYSVMSIPLWSFVTPLCSTCFFFHTWNSVFPEVCVTYDSFFFTNFLILVIFFLNGPDFCFVKLEFLLTGVR